MKPTIGRIVLYNTTEEDRKVFATMKGNPRKQLPAMIVAVCNANVINLKVFLDGHGDIWLTSIFINDPENPTEGTWEFPIITK